MFKASPDYQPMTPPMYVAEHYFRMPKHIGSISTQELDTIIDRSTKAIADYEHDEKTAKLYREIKASSLVERAFVDHNGDIDCRIASLKEAQDLTKAVADTEYHELVDGVRDPDDQIRWRRATLLHAFSLTHAYSDIIAGELTKETQRETLDMLTEQRHYTERMLNSDYASDAAGLINEIVAMQSMWQNTLSDHHKMLVAIPSTARGGNGYYRRPETHDIAVAHLDHNGFEEPVQWEYYEVKAKTALRPEHLGRYAARLMIVDKRQLIEYR